MENTPAVQRKDVSFLAALHDAYEALPGGCKMALVPPGLFSSTLSGATMYKIMPMLLAPTVRDVAFGVFGLVLIVPCAGMSLAMTGAGLYECGRQIVKCASSSSDSEEQLGDIELTELSNAEEESINELQELHSIIVDEMEH